MAAQEVVCGFWATTYRNGSSGQIQCRLEWECTDGSWGSSYTDMSLCEGLGPGTSTWNSMPCATTHAHTPMRHAAVFVALFFSMSACGQGDSDVVEAAYPASVQQALGSIEFARVAGVPMGGKRHALREAMTAMYDIAGQAGTWQEADAMAQERIGAAEDDLVRMAVSQSTSKLMLTGFLIPNRGEPGAPESALRYARILVDEGSPEAPTVLDVVEAFGDVWRSTDTRAIALGAAEAAEAHVRLTAPCPECDAPEAARRALHESGQTADVVSLQRLDAAAKLRAVADNLPAHDRGLGS